MFEVSPQGENHQRMLLIYDNVLRFMKHTYTFSGLTSEDFKRDTLYKFYPTTTGFACENMTASSFFEARDTMLAYVLQLSELILPKKEGPASMAEYLYFLYCFLHGSHFFDVEAHYMEHHEDAKKENNSYYLSQSLEDYFHVMVTAKIKLASHGTLLGDFCHCLEYFRYDIPLFMGATTTDAKDCDIAENEKEIIRKVGKTYDCLHHIRYVLDFVEARSGQKNSGQEECPTPFHDYRDTLQSILKQEPALFPNYEELLDLNEHRTFAFFTKEELLQLIQFDPRTMSFILPRWHNDIEKFYQEHPPFPLFHYHLDYNFTAESHKAFSKFYIWVQEIEANWDSVNKKQVMGTLIQWTSYLQLYRQVDRNSVVDTSETSESNEPFLTLVYLAFAHKLSLSPKFNSMSLALSTDQNGMTDCYTEHMFSFSVVQEGPFSLTSGLFHGGILREQEKINEELERVNAQLEAQLQLQRVQISEAQHQDHLRQMLPNIGSSEKSLASCSEEERLSWWHIQYSKGNYIDLMQSFLLLRAKFEQEIYNPDHWAELFSTGMLPISPQCPSNLSQMITDSLQEVIYHMFAVQFSDIPPQQLKSDESFGCSKRQTQFFLYLKQSIASDGILDWVKQNYCHIHLDIATPWEQFHFKPNSFAYHHLSYFLKVLWLYSLNFAKKEGEISLNYREEEDGFAIEFSSDYHPENAFLPEQIEDGLESISSALYYYNGQHQRVKFEQQGNRWSIVLFLQKNLLGTGELL